MGKTLWELIEDCKTRGRVEDVVIFNAINNRVLGRYDVYDAIEIYGEGIICKHRRDRTHIRVWIV